MVIPNRKERCTCVCFPKKEGRNKGTVGKKGRDRKGPHVTRESTPGIASQLKKVKKKGVRRHPGREKRKAVKRTRSIERRGRLEAYPTAKRFSWKSEQGISSVQRGRR